MEEKWWRDVRGEMLEKVVEKWWWRNGGGEVLKEKYYGEK